MQRIYRNLTRANLVSSSLEKQLGLLDAAAAVPVEWEELTGLVHLSPSFLFQSGFVGLVELRTVLEDLVCLFCDLFLSMIVCACTCIYIHVHVHLCHVMSHDCHVAYHSSGISSSRYWVTI